MTGGVLCIPIWVHAIRNKKLLFRDLLIFALMSTVAVASWCYQNRELAHERNLPYLLFALIPIPFFAFRKRLGISEKSFMFFGTAYFLTVLWYAPVGRQLVGLGHGDDVFRVAQDEELSHGCDDLEFPRTRSGLCILADPVRFAWTRWNPVFVFRENSAQAAQTKQAKFGIHTASIVLPRCYFPPFSGH